MSLYAWCYLLGVFSLVVGVSSMGAPRAISQLYRALPRNKAAGWIISAIAWIWAAMALTHMGLDLLVPFQKYIPAITLVCIPLTWVWMDNLLASRAIGAVLALFPHSLLQVARTHHSAWRLVLVTLAYVCAVQGMILLLYPWKMRQAVEILTSRVCYVRISGFAHALLGVVLLVLGYSVLR